MGRGRVAFAPQDGEVLCATKRAKRDSLAKIVTVYVRVKMAEHATT